MSVIRLTRIYSNYFMIEKEIKIEERVMPYSFWLFASLTALLIITFVYYLPLRFQHQAEEHMGEQMGGAMHEMQEAANHEESEVREGLAVNLNITPVPVFVGTSTRLDFFVNNKPGNIPVTNLEIEHTKLMHVIGVRNDMEEFFHIHPIEIQSGLFSVGHAFVKPGLYKIWSEIKKDGMNHTFGHPEFAVEGEGEKSYKEVSFARNIIVDDYQVSLKLDEPLAKGHEAHLFFDIHTLTSGEVEVEEYLGAPMHLTIIKDDWKQFIHTHPENGGHILLKLDFNRMIREAKAHVEEEKPLSGGDETINFHITFPETGLYKIFAQFRPKGIDLIPDEALIASFWIKVEEKVPLAASKWMLAAISLVFIVLLSLAAKGYLTVKP